MKDDFECFIKSSILDRKRKLSIHDEFIEFEDNDLATGNNSKFYSKDITSFRFGLKWINGYKFTIGRIYCIDVKNKENQIIKLRLKSIYGIRINELHKKYASIVNKLIDIHFKRISEKYIQQFRNRDEFILLSIKFLEEGIQLKNKKKILWEDLGTKNYHNKYNLFSKSDKNVYVIFEYFSDWNTVVLFSVIEQIIIDKKEKLHN